MIRIWSAIMHALGYLGAVLLANLVAAADWPQWRGPERDGHAGSSEPAPESALFLTAPKVSWKASIGPGFSSPIIAQGKVLLCDARDGQEWARCLDAGTGKELWAAAYAPMFEDEWGTGPRSTPFTDGERVYVQSCSGEFRCLNISDGSAVWGFNFEKDYKVKFLGSKAREGTAQRRGNNGSGLLDGDAVIIPVGAADGATLVCRNKLTGEPIWTAGNEEAAYSSLMVADLAGMRQVVGLMADGLIGVDRTRGKVLWRVPLRTNAKRHAMTPIISGNRVIVNSHTFGMICFEIVREGEEFKAKEAWRNDRLKINLATPVVVGEHLYSHGPARNFVCAELATGRERWSADGFGKEYSSVVALGGKDLLVLTDDGEGVWLRANPERYEELGRGQLAGKNWNHAAVAGGQYYVRDQRELIAYRLR